MASESNTLYHDAPIMTVYQSEYQAAPLVLPVSLLISSVPRAVLMEPEPLFVWMESIMKPSGVAFIDVPSTPDIYTIHVQRAACAVGWEEKWCFTFRDFYQPGDRQSLLALASKDIEIANHKIPYQRCHERKMKHQCEFDPFFIRYLIENFSQTGDIVLDPFCGTGMVPRVARNLNRCGIGIDERCPFTNQLRHENLSNRSTSG